MVRLYRYVAPQRIAERARTALPGMPVTASGDVARWAQATGQGSDAGGCVVATFVVDQTGVLCGAARRSEHVACAGGGPVAAAGEITFALRGASAEVVAVSNQSTGYCPEARSWPSVEAALGRAGFAVPEGFKPVCVLRRCLRCGSICVVKDAEFECPVCGAELPAAYNCQDEALPTPGAAADRPHDRR